MRSIRLRRVAVLFAAALGLLASQVPAAHAADAMVVVIAGTATLDGPLSYPCVNPGTPPSLSMPGTGKCPSVTTNGKKIPIGVTGGNTRAVTDFVSAQCAAAGTYLGTVANPLSPCTVKDAEDGIVTGSCGLSSGLILVLITILVFGQTPALDPDAHITTLAWVHWTGIGTTLLITGTTYDGKLIIGTVNAIPRPVPTATPPGIGNSCLGKTATTFEISGGVVVYSAP